MFFYKPLNFLLMFKRGRARSYNWSYNATALGVNLLPRSKLGAANAPTPDYIFLGITSGLPVRVATPGRRPSRPRTRRGGGLSARLPNGRPRHTAKAALANAALQVVAVTYFDELQSLGYLLRIPCSGACVGFCAP